MFIAAWEDEGGRLTREGKDWIFVSDAHFTGQEQEGMRAFLRFLDLEKPSLGHLVILGDLFEFLFDFKIGLSRRNRSLEERVFPFSDYLPVFEKLKSLEESNIQITYGEGNHDFCLSSFFRDQLRMKVEVHPKGWEEKLGNRKVFLAHGDLSNPRQWRYRLFRKVLKNSLTYGLMRWVGPRVCQRVARRMSEKSRLHYHQPLRESGLEVFRQFARRKFEEGFDVVILAHSHHPEALSEEVGERRCFYFNLGDWMIHRSYLRFSPPETFALCRFEEEASI